MLILLIRIIFIWQARKNRQKYLDKNNGHIWGRISLSQVGLQRQVKLTFVIQKHGQWRWGWGWGVRRRSYLCHYDRTLISANNWSTRVQEPQVSFSSSSRRDEVLLVLLASFYHDACTHNLSITNYFNIGFISKVFLVIQFPLLADVFMTSVLFSVISQACQ